MAVSPVDAEEDSLLLRESPLFAADCWGCGCSGAGGGGAWWWCLGGAWAGSWAWAWAWLLLLLRLQVHGDSRRITTIRSSDGGGGNGGCALAADYICSTHCPCPPVLRQLPVPDPVPVPVPIPIALPVCGIARRQVQSSHHIAGRDSRLQLAKIRPGILSQSKKKWNRTSIKPTSGE